MSADRLDELITMAALGELTTDEERELDRLLAADAGASAELRSTLDAAAAVQASLAEAPPADLRDRVLAATEAMPQAPSAGATVVDLAGRRRWRMATVAAAAAAAVVIVVGAAVLVQEGSGERDEIAAVVDAPDVVERRLGGELGELTVFFSPTERAVVVDGRDVRLPLGDNTFELWLVAGSEAIPVGLFRPDGDGRVVERFDDLDITGFVLGVTEEPAGGSETPTLPILASA